MKKKIKLLVAVLSVLLVCYLGYQTYQALSPRILTETVVKHTADYRLQKNGYVIREEKLLTTNKTGQVVYAVLNGTRVSEGTEVVNIYRSEGSAETAARIREIGSELEMLHSLADFEGTVGTELSVLNESLSESLAKTAQSIEKSNYFAISDQKIKIQELMSKRQLLIGNVRDYQERIDMLEAERSRLQNTLSDELGSVQSPGAGYFISMVDGFENQIQIQDTREMPYAKVRSLLRAEPNEPPPGCVGKIIEKFYWYMAVEMTISELEQLPSLKTVSINIPSASLYNVSAAVETINYDDLRKNAILVLKCNYMSRELASVRKTAVELNTKKYTGLKISSGAVRVVDGVKGVYVMSGAQMRFREIDVVYTGNGFVISRIDPNNAQLVKQYDEIVLEGKNLYDGKFV